MEKVDYFKKGNPVKKKRLERRMANDDVVLVNTEGVKETVIYESFYRPIPLSIL